MRIVQVNTHDIQGGAAKVAHDLYLSLKSLGYDSRMLVGEKVGTEKDVETVESSRSFPSRLITALRSGLRRFDEKYGLQYFFEYSGKQLLKHEAIKNADIVHFHNTHGGYLNLWAVQEVSQKKNVVWTLHDMWALTGHCAHSFDCVKWKTGCHKCTYLDTYPSIRRDTASFLWKVKSRSAQRSNLVITSPSKWLSGLLAESFLSNKPTETIGNAVDTSIFKPGDKTGSRSRLNLPRDKFILIMTADNIKVNPWKGFDYLINALRMIKEGSKKKIFLVIIGNYEEFKLADLGIEGVCVGRLKEPGLIAEYNRASDVFLLPSIAENSPLVLLEAFACGLPVIGFDIGGIPELILHKKTGYLSAYKNTSDFAQGIEWFLSLNVEIYNQVCVNCISMINEKHTLQAQTNNFLYLYANLLGLRHQ